MISKFRNTKNKEKYFTEIKIKISNFIRSKNNYFKFYRDVFLIG